MKNWRLEIGHPLKSVYIAMNKKSSIILLIHEYVHKAPGLLFVVNVHS